MKNFLFLVISAIIIVFTFVNCANNSDNTPAATPAAVDSLVWLKDVNYNFVGTDYPMKLGRFKSENLTKDVYVQWIPNGCTSACRTLVVANPYGGLDWTDDDADKTWLGRANADVGYIHPDVEGPGFLPGASPGTLFYQKQSPDQGAGMGAVFLPNKISVLVIGHRFYRGRNLKNYVQEFQKVVSHFILNGFVDDKKMVFFGASLGGFITLQAALDFKYPPLGLALMSPLLDLKKQVQFLDQLPITIGDAAVVSGYNEFFDPYLRRIFDFTGGRPADSAAAAAAFVPYTIENIVTRLKSKVLMLHDTWDTLTPVSEAIALQQQSSSQSNILLYHHATPINWVTFKRDHSQPGEGLNSENTWPWYSLYAYNLLMDPTESVVMYYDYLKFSNFFVEAKAASVRAQDVSGLKNRILELCSTRLRMIDYTGQIGEVTGQFYTQQVMKNIWGYDRPETTICDDLKTYTF